MSEFEVTVELQLLGLHLPCFPECVAKGSRLTLDLGVELCSRPVASMFATVRNRSQPSATVRNRPQPSATVRNCPQ